MSTILGRYIRTYQKEVLLAPLFKFLEACFELAVPLIIAQLIDKTIVQKQTTGLAYHVFMLIVLALLGLVMALAAQFYTAKAAVGISSQVSRDLFAKILSTSQAERDRWSVASLVNRVTTDSLQLQTGINLFLRLFLRAPIIVFGSLVMAFSISPNLSVYFLTMIISLFALVFYLSRSLKPLYQNSRLLFDRLITKTREQMAGMRVIRAFNHSRHELADFQVLNQELYQTQVTAGEWSALLPSLTFLLVNGTLIILLWQGHVLVQNSVLSQGMIIALVNYLLQILVELLKLTMLLQSLNQAYISSKRIGAILELPDEQLDMLSVCDNSLLVSEVTFTYPNSAAPALDNIDFQVLSGQHLGIVGGTGSGKSTLVHLLSGLYPVTEGRISFPQSDGRSLIGLVPQKAGLFQGSVRDNLTLDMIPSPTDDEIWRALHLAQADGFVRELDGQLDSLILAFGRSLSGGQRQRLNIARAILRQPRYLILDDATSALDYLTESRLLNALRRELTSTTLIIVSQRTRLLECLDRILVLENGKQVGFASHEELLAGNPVYQEIYTSQHLLEKENEHV